jgi:hypothetical protein
MQTDLLQNKEFVEVYQESTFNALKGKVDDNEIKKFLNSPEVSKTAKPIEAKAGIIMVVLYGNVECKPTTKKWKFEHSVWGAGAAGFTSLGFMYTAYENWDDFFTLTTSFHVQGIAEAGGVFQINWFNKQGLPVGQYNGAAAGIGTFQAGSKGKWKRR